MATKEFCRLGEKFCQARKELYSARKKSGRLPKEFGQAKLLGGRVQLLYNRAEKVRFTRGERYILVAAVSPLLDLLLKLPQLPATAWQMLSPGLSRKTGLRQKVDYLSKGQAERHVRLLTCFALAA